MAPISAAASANPATVSPSWSRQRRSGKTLFRESRLAGEAADLVDRRRAALLQELPVARLELGADQLALVLRQPHRLHAQAGELLVVLLQDLVADARRVELGLHAAAGERRLLVLRQLAPAIEVHAAERHQQAEARLDAVLRHLVVLGAEQHARR